MAQQEAPQQERPRGRRIWGYFRLVVITVLSVILVVSIARGEWADIPITAIFIALLLFLEAMDRGLLRRFFGRSGGEPPPPR